MRKSLLTIALTTILSFSILIGVSAEIPDKTIVIGNKGYSLDYANDKSNRAEIVQVLGKNKNQIYIKFNGKWFDNSKNIIDPSILNEIEYKDNNSITTYLKGDGAIKGTKKTEEENSDVDTQDILGKVFTIGDHSVSIMQMGLPAQETLRVNEINERFQKSIKNNQKWFGEYMNKYSKQEEILPWNEKFGVSKEEYDEMISLLKKIHLIEMKKTNISIVEERDGKLRLESNEDLPYLSGIKIDTINNCIIISELGVLEYSNEINVSEEQKVTSSWRGGTWKLEFDQLKDFNFDNIDNNKTYGWIKISVRELEESKQIIVYYDEKVIHQGYSYKGREIILFNN